MPTQGQDDVIAVLNLSKILRPEHVLAIVDACSRQQAEHVCPAWNVPHRPINLFSDVSELPPGTTDVGVILDEPGDPGTLGWHSMGIVPFGRVFVKPILDGGGTVLGVGGDSDMSIAGVFSHEFGIELPVDPTCDLYALDAHGSEWDLEPGDPTQLHTYVIQAKMPWGDEAVAVQNFALPNWYIPGSEGPWDYLGQCSRPFEILPGGYAMRNGDPLFGATLPPAWYLAMRPPGRHRYNRGYRQRWTAKEGM